MIKLIASVILLSTDKPFGQIIQRHITKMVANYYLFYTSILRECNFSKFQIFLTFQKMNLLPLIMSKFLQKKDQFQRMMVFKLQLILYLMAN